MDFGFMRALALVFSQAAKSKDRVVFLYNGFYLYLLIIDKASRYIWVFLTKSKEPPINIVLAFL